MGEHTVTEGTFRHRGADLAYEVAGEGPLAVYAHGGFAGRAAEDRMGLFDWAPVVASGRRLVRYDARGHGRSTGEPVDGDYTYPSLAGDLLALLDHLGAARPVDAMGASMGCATVLHSAVRAPSRFSRLVLLVPPTAWTTREAYARGNRESAATVERDGVDAWLATRARRPRPPVAAGVPDVPPTPAGRVLPSVLRGLALSDLPAPGALAGLRLPCLVLAWADDPGHPLSTAETAARLLHAELHVARARADVRAWGERIAAYLSRPRP
ncbi:alpha/beta fold hydrolase [Streptomyces sp. WAC05374]|uniref:alpha/beta fold hydrolase n=1 Tax=Streptomyces sp. WAC05374 TaxID=2487420 RepID=UPI000F893F19|nr:alpha/beta fold hydrolase [Streptomyces sp. WAC05374]RST14800.1 alpha/beta fold hydrolase [Streptomyces sp. WAC05374]TDF47838.1 alpha/beta fold hydrolase [Streptomyces sp. WAC05374]TDF54011.1 alpha/beta fold hydrolase [Streptomyces sp. WAC05374]